MLLLQRFSLVSVVVLISICGMVSAYNSCVVHNETFIPDEVLRITAENTTQSCLPSKSVVLVNGTSPGPALFLTEGETYWIRVYNDMPDQNLTMHWHGLSMAASPFSDGTPLASQWPIPPLHFFDYEINVPIGMAGTYFYHSHVGFQAISAAGPLIVDDLNVPYAYDEEKIIFLQDVFSKNDSTIEAGLVASPLSWSGESAMILVNGHGGGTSNGTVCNSSLSAINVEPNKTYRLRFIGGTALSFVSLAIEGHDCLTVIEADGEVINQIKAGAYTQPYNTSFLQIGTGQRFSVLLQTKAVPEQKTYTMQLESRERPTVTRSFAVLNYGDRLTSPPYPPSTPPLTLPNTTLDFLDYHLQPLALDDDYPTLEEVTRTVTITVHQSVRGPTVWLQNLYPWTDTFPKEPYLVSLYKDDGTEFPSMERALNNSGLDPVSRAFPAEIGEVLEIVIQNTASDSGSFDAHPFHAHGAHYYDMGSGNGTYNATENDAKWNGSQPVKRDTTMLYRYNGVGLSPNNTDMGWRAWRLRVTQPGVWMIHCHILQHMIMGMQTVWVMGNETEVLQADKLDVEGYLVYGGNVMGNESHWPEVVEFQSEPVWTESIGNETES